MKWRLGAPLAPLAVVIAVLAIPASAQLPVSFEAQVVPLAPPVGEQTYAARDYGKDGIPSADDRTATTKWRVVKDTGNCCENYVTATRAGPPARLRRHVRQLLGRPRPDVDRRYVRSRRSSTARARSCSRRTATSSASAGTRTRATTCRRTSTRRTPASGSYTETPLHQPFYDREWVTVVPGPFTIDGETVEYISFLKGGWPSKELWYWSTDGLNYTNVSSKIVDQTLSGAAARTLATTARSDADWNQQNTNTGMTTLGEHALLAAPDYPSSNSAWALFDGKAFAWVPVEARRRDDAERPLPGRLGRTAPQRAPAGEQVHVPLVGGQRHDLEVARRRAPGRLRDRGDRLPRQPGRGRGGRAHPRPGQQHGR